jgi:nicotinamide-nucleotide amidase
MSDAAVSRRRARVRAGILVTGTEVLNGIIADRNGPWLSERLRELGVDAATIQVVGDRPDDLRGALSHMMADGYRLIVTSGGLGPTADDLTAQIVGELTRRPLVLDGELEREIARILRPLLERTPELDRDALLAANRKQAVIPEGAVVLQPVGTAPGLILSPRDESAPTFVVLPGPPRELQPMWRAAVETPALRAAIAGAATFHHATLRLFGIPESEIAETLRRADAAGIELGQLEITTCLRRGEIEVATRYEPEASPAYEALVAFIERRHPHALFSRDGATIDEQVAALLAGERIATGESCTGGMLAARLTDRPGASSYVAGGVVAYSNEAKTALLDVDPQLIAAEGAVSGAVARALAQGARNRFGASVGVGITGVAGPGGGSEAKPVGTVCFCVSGPGELTLTRTARLPGAREDIRDRSCTVALHLIARFLRGEHD